MAKLLRQFISDNVQSQPPTSDDKLMRSVGDMFDLEVELFEASPRKVTPELEKETTDAVTFRDFVDRVAAKVCKSKGVHTIGILSFVFCFFFSVSLLRKLQLVMEKSLQHESHM